MATQKGFEYEKNLYTELKGKGIAGGNPPAGAESDRPDLEIKLVKDPNTKTEGCELKLAPTAGGSLVMKYTDDKWYFDPKSMRDKEKAFMIGVAKKANLLQEMNTRGQYGRNWRNKVPYLQNDFSGRKILVEGVNNKREAYALDIKQFSGKDEIKIPVPAKVMCDYYNLKDTHYLNVASHGFFLMNTKDPLNLNKNISPAIPDFSLSAKLQIRVRCQYKGSGDYQFVMTLEFGGVTTSPYNIGPILSKNNVQIDKRNLYNEANKPLLKKFGYEI
jgi:hypothetical protein